MRRHIGTSVGLMVALAAGVFALVASGPAQATSGGCFVPSVAVDVLLDEAESAGFDEDVGRCKRQCKEIFETCRMICKWSDRCIEAVIRGFFRFEKIDCGNEGEASSACNDAARSDKNSFLDFLSEDKASARQDCRDFRSECIAFCEGALL